MGLSGDLPVSLEVVELDDGDDREVATEAIHVVCPSKVVDRTVLVQAGADSGSTKSGG